MNSQTPPTQKPPENTWEYFELWTKINELIRTLPNFFQSQIVVKGINATDVYAVGSLFSSAIESSLVEGLNKMRNIWDPENKYLSFAFKRQSQTFPDVLLVDSIKNDKIIFGIELKAWYALSKEEEPSFRFKVDPDACAEPDLLVVFPWLLSDVIAGQPILLPPFVELAKYAAEARNYYWQQSRIADGKNANINRPAARFRNPYPSAKKDASDSAEDDKGNNFGRVARAGQGSILENYLDEILNLYYLGIKIKHWLRIFKSIAEGRDDKKIEVSLDKVLTEVRVDIKEQYS